MKKKLLLPVFCTLAVISSGYHNPGIFLNDKLKVSVKNTKSGFLIEDIPNIRNWPKISSGS